MLAREVSSAYKANPMLGALLILNLATLGGFGWYLWDKEAKTGKYVLALQSDIRELRSKAIDLAFECNHQKGSKR